MPSELRILRFRLHEAEHALRALAPRIALNVPDGSFVSAKLEPDGETPSTCFKVKGEENRVCVSNGQLAASLIYHCRKCGIELPDDGTKEIYVSPEFVELRVVLRHSPANGACNGRALSAATQSSSLPIQQSS